MQFLLKPFWLLQNKVNGHASESIFRCIRNNFLQCKAAVSWKFGHCSACASLKIWWIIMHEHKYSIMGVHWKIQFLGEGVTKNQHIGRNFLKRGAWTVFRFKGRFGKKGGYFWGGVDTPMLYDLTWLHQREKY